ncbi:MAG: polysaccharide biosynthesis/export family protein [Bacteroidales bacterium]|nr:polysaccharide biosynthesis/export family protein [Bacteroidales bacterium]
MKETSGYVKSIIILVLITGIFSSCVPRKKLLYLQTSDEDTITGKSYPELIEPYRIKPGNSLYLRLLTSDNEMSFLGSGSNLTTSYDAGIYLQSYSVNDSGFIEIPILGSILCGGKTINEATDAIQTELDKYLKGVTVIVKLVNFNISVVGEVNRPGQFMIYQDKVNIFEVLSMAGDLTAYAKRDEILLIRNNEKGSEIFRLNLQDPAILASEHFYLKPNDIIYAKPVKGRSFVFATFPYAVVFGTITTVLLIINLFR